MRRLQTISIVMACCAAASSAAGDYPDASKSTGNSAPEYDMMYIDSQWCGPRILFFFSCYLRDGRLPLDQVVQRCEADADGKTSLFDLVRAARELGLDPHAVKCTADELLAAGGSAIICLRSRQPIPIDTGRPTSDVAHFVGVLRPTKTGPLWLIDPSRRCAPFPVESAGLLSAFTWHAVFLDGTAPEGPATALPFLSKLVVAAGVAGASGVLTVALARLRRARPSKLKGGSPCA
ncbi:MAG TPA: hypothetical protein VND64_26685 [Pirellulales bacterium]|nr:hypothetical protein [Pirellulales bacterium]